MSRYIDADALIRYGKCGTLVYWEDIEETPSIDIVRCRECVFGEADTEADMYRCRNVSFPMWNKADDFCSYGERKE